MNTSTLIGLKYAGIAAVLWFALAFVLCNVGLRADVVLIVLGFAALPCVAVAVSHAAYAAGKRERRVVELHDA